MSEQERQLLLKELCARFPSGIYVRYENGGIIETRELGLGTLHDFMFGNADVKPYLRPMSSMTEEEEKDLRLIKQSMRFDEDVCMMEDFFKQKHLDNRHLIEKGLALEAPEGMYSKQ